MPPEVRSTPLEMVEVRRARRWCVLMTGRWMPGYSSSAASLLALERGACGRGTPTLHQQPGDLATAHVGSGRLREHGHPERRSIPAIDVGKTDRREEHEHAISPWPEFGRAPNSPGTTVTNRALQMAICTPSARRGCGDHAPSSLPPRPLRMALLGRTRRPPDPGAGWSKRALVADVNPARSALRAAPPRSRRDHRSGSSDPQVRAIAAGHSPRPADAMATAPHLVDKPRAIGQIHGKRTTHRSWDRLAVVLSFRVTRGTQLGLARPCAPL
jgi:hypothetical protein